MIIIESKRKKPATILKKYPDAILADVVRVWEGKTQANGKQGMFF